MQNSVFVGYAAEKAQLYQSYLKAMAGAPQIAFVSGEAGSGKTALVENFLRQAAAENNPAKIVRVRCTLESENRGFIPFISLIRTLYNLEIQEAAQKRSQREDTQRTMKLLKALAPAVLDLLFADVPSKIVNAWDALSQYLSKNSIEAPIFSQSSVFEQFRSLILEKCKKQALVIFFDDIQWIDLSSLALLTYLIQNPPACPLYIIAAYRPLTVLASSDKKDMLLEMIRCGGVEIPELKRGISVSDYVKARFPGNDIPPEMIADLQKKTDGFPLFVAELFNWMIEKKAIVRLPDNAGYQFSPAAIQEMDIPASVSAVIRQRLNGVSKVLMELLTVASVEGEEFTVQVAAQILNLEPIQALKMLEELKQTHYLVVEGGQQMVQAKKGVSRFRFAHRFFRDYIYEHMGKAMRSNLHANVAQRLEELYSAQPELVAGQLSQHYLEAEQLEKALLYSLIAAEAEQAKYCWAEASLLAKRAYEIALQIPDHQRMAKALVIWEKNAYHFDRLDEVAVRLEDGLRILEGRAQERAALFDLLIALAHSYYWLSDNRAAEIAQRAVEIAQELQSPALIYDAKYALQDVLENQYGKFEQTRIIDEELIELARQMKDIYREVDALGMLAWALIDLGEYSQAIARCKEAQRVMEENHLEQRELKYMLLRFAGRAYWEKGDYPEGLKLFEESLQSYRLSGDNNILAYVLVEMADMLSEMPHYHEKAWANLDEALQYTKAAGDDAASSYACLYMANLATLQKDLVRAKKALDEAQLYAPSAGLDVNAIDRAVFWTNYYLASGDLGAAQKSAAEALRLLEGGESVINQVWVYLVVGQVSLQTGDQAGAEKWIFTCSEILKKKPEMAKFQAETERLWGELGIQRGQFIEAYEHFKKCYEIYRGLSHDWMVAKVMPALIHAGIQAGSYQALKRSYSPLQYPTPVIAYVDLKIFFETYFTPCLECGFCQDVCCQYGVDIDILNVKRIGVHAEALEKFTGISRKDWFSQDYQKSEESAGGFYTRTQTREGACVFLNRKGRGCLLQSFCEVNGIDYHQLKPFISSLFPITFESGLLQPSWEIMIKELVCMGHGTSLYRGVRDELLYYFGQEFVAELDQIEQGCIILHGPVR